MIHVSHWRPLSRAVLLAVAVGGVAAVALVPGDSASKTALGLGAVAIAIAAGCFGRGDSCGGRPDQRRWRREDSE